MRKSESKNQLKTAMLMCALTSLTPQLAVAGNSVSTPPTSISEIQQQNAVAKGKIVDSKGEPLIGVSVVEAGTSNGTVDRKSTRLNSSHSAKSRMPSSA